MYSLYIAPYVSGPIPVGNIAILHSLDIIIGSLNINISLILQNIVFFEEHIHWLRSRPQLYMQELLI